MTPYQVALDVYNGPMDLLLFLIRREEVDVYDIPVARITEQYLQHVELLRRVDPEVAGEFLVLAATLMEIKSRMLLPRPPVEEMEEEIADPRLELVRQLLEYKKFKDAAYALEDSAVRRALQYERQPIFDSPHRDEIELENLEIWDLFEAFNRLLAQTGKRNAVHQVSVDDTPIALHAEDILDSIERAGRSQPFDEVFAGRTLAEMIGLFLALLELIRQKRVRVSQAGPTCPIQIELLDSTPLELPSPAVPASPGDMREDKASKEEALTASTDQNESDPTGQPEEGTDITDPAASADPSPKNCEMAITAGKESEEKTEDHVETE